MVVLQHVVAPDGVAAGRGYSQVVTGRGRLVVVSGQIAQDERGELVGAGVLRRRRGRCSRTCAAAWHRPGRASTMW
jgi:enamine deaminase RidA (YjgF/YER057c/UK114 family)